MKISPASSESDMIFFIDISGEWWNADPEAVINQALQTGAGPNVSDAYTINGLPGPLYNCSSNGNISNYDNN